MLGWGNLHSALSGLVTEVASEDGEDTSEDVRWYGEKLGSGGGETHSSDDGGEEKRERVERGEDSNVGAINSVSEVTA